MLLNFRAAESRPGREIDTQHSLFSHIWIIYRCDSVEVSNLLNNNTIFSFVLNYIFKQTEQSSIRVSWADTLPPIFFYLYNNNK